jgi:hypothetical protein
VTFNLSVIGLTLDLIGVVILGVDLVRVQQSIRTAARQRLEEWQSLLEENDLLDGDLEKLKAAGNWRETDYEEGRTYFINGTFDASAAATAFAELAGTNQHQGRLLAILAENLEAAAASDAKTSQISLRWTYFAMILIVFGFAFQIGGQSGL